MTHTSLRLVAGTAASALSGYCAFSAFKNGMALAPNDVMDAYLLGAAGAAVAVYGWVALPLADAYRAAGERVTALAFRVSYVLALAFVMMNAITFTATHKAESTGFKTEVITAYDAAVAGLASAQKDLDQLRNNDRWAKTAGCSNATVTKSQEFCSQVTMTKANISSYERTIKAGRPAAADAGSDQLSWLTRMDATTVARLTPVVWAATLEVVCTFAWWGFFGSQRRKAAPVVVAPAARAVDVSPLWEALGAADAALAMLAHAQAVREEWHAGTLEAWFAKTVAPATEVPAVTVELVPVTAPAPVKKAKAAKKAPKVRRMRDENGRFASKKPRLATVEHAPKPRLAELPLLGGTENVVILGRSEPKND